MPSWLSSSSEQIYLTGGQWGLGLGIGYDITPKITIKGSLHFSRSKQEDFSNGEVGYKAYVP